MHSTTFGRLHLTGVACGLFAATAICAPATADLFVLTDPSGLAAEAEFDIIDPVTMRVRLRNVSTGVPNGFSNSDQILTSVSWDFGAPGENPGDPTILSGSVMTGPNSASVNFDVASVGSNADVSGEWGFGNTSGSGLLENFITAMASHATPFGGANLDGPVNLDGPQGGLVSDPIHVPLGGLGAIQDEVVATLTLSGPISDLRFLDNGVRVEFGSDAHFITSIPGPAAMPLLGLAGLVGVGRRRRID